MYIKYNAKIYDLIYSNFEKKYVITTYFDEKVDESFYKMWDYYAKDYVETDQNIQDIYDVDFYVTYTDDSETLKKADKQGKWLVNEGRPLYRNPEIEENELGLSLIKQSFSEDWIMDDRCSCSKIVDLYDCSDYTVVYTYIFKDGQKLDEKEVVEIEMTADEFKKEMIKYKAKNI